jgi:UPF0755 protein
MKRAKIIIILLVVVLFVAIASAYILLYAPNTSISKKSYLYIKTGSTYSDVINQLEKKKLLNSVATFKIVASRMNYKNRVKPGKYLLKPGLGNYKLVQLLRSGKQDPVHLVFNNIRTKQDFAGRIAEQLEADSVTILNHLNDKDFMSQFGLNSENALTLFIPNTYQLWWNTNPDDFFKRMSTERDKFWNVDRIGKAKAINLTHEQVVILASIVEKESNKNDEKPVVAGVYLNRLKKGMLLQADPTLIFAWNDFTIRRVLNVHKTIDSPYNTYKYKGLPPGPIYLPDIKSIDAVLNYQHHDYIYFCAKEDLSGYHNFARTPQEHALNAARYRKALDVLNIKK